MCSVFRSYAVGTSHARRLAATPVGSPGCGLFAPPGLDAGMVAGEQHLGHAVAPPVGRARVMRVLERALEGGRERLLLTRRVVCERARQQPRERVHDRHRHGLAAAQHERAEAEGLRRDVLERARVEALVAAAEERDALARCELARVRVVEAAAAGIECHDASAGARRCELAAVGALDGAGHRVDAHEHARTAAERRVVHLRVRQRRVVAIREEAQRQRARQGALHRGFLRQPGEPVGEEREDIDLEHGRLATRRAARRSPPPARRRARPRPRPEPPRA
jgi:hypothetical protein